MMASLLIAMALGQIPADRQFQARHGIPMEWHANDVQPQSYGSQGGQMPSRYALAKQWQLDSQASRTANRTHLRAMLEHKPDQERQAAALLWFAKPFAEQGRYSSAVLCSAAY